MHNIFPDTCIDLENTIRREAAQLWHSHTVSLRGNCLFSYFFFQLHVWYIVQGTASLFLMVNGIAIVIFPSTIEIRKKLLKKTSLFGGTGAL
jgi:hypothetical protein